MIAALVMLAAELLWRTQSSSDGVVQALPEFIAAAIAKLTPISLFGTVTETYGSAAKKTLLVACVVGVIVVGIWAGRIAWRLANPPAPSFFRRLGAGLAVAAGLLAFVFLVILPIANLGIAANKSSHSTEIQTQLLISFALFAVVWTMLTGEPVPVVATDGATVSRRTFLFTGTWLVLGLGSIAAIVASLADMFRTPEVSAEELALQETAAEDIVATQRAVSANATPLQGADLFASLEANGMLTPVLTTTADFYHVSKNFTDPTVGADNWSLQIGGLVDNPLTFTLDQLQQLATTKKITTLCCISNEINGDLISTGEWQGVPLSDLLAQAGVQATAVDLKFTAADDYQDSVPVAIGQDPNVLLVVGMNGQPLPDDHGFPARLIIPPIYGMKNVKWITKIEAVQADFIGYWQEQGWSDDAHYRLWGRIDHPTKDIAPGATYVCGMASAGDRGIQRVELTFDDGQTWADAELEPSLNDRFTWRRWALPYNATSGDVKVRMRATDGTGEVMQEKREPPIPNGATGWPSRSFSVH